MMFSLQKNEKDARVTFEMFLPMLQDVSSKPIRDTVDDFVEGLKHFDKVIYIVFCFLEKSQLNLYYAGGEWSHLRRGAPPPAHWAWGEDERGGGEAIR